MDKYIEVLCKQNPKITLSCGNPDCKKEHTFKTNQVFKSKSFEFECNYCSKITQYDTSKFIKEFSDKFKKLGITVE